MTEIGKSKIQVLIKVGYNLPDLKFSDLNSHVFFLTSGALTIVSNLKSYHERLSVHLDCCKPVKMSEIGKSKIQVLIKVGYYLLDLKVSDLNSYVFSHG